LKEVFLGRCWEYQLYHSPHLFATGLKDCNALYEKFLDVFVGKSACGEVFLEDYNEFLDAASHPMPEDKSMFWSGTYALGLSYGNRGARAYTLEQSLPGYILNRMNWCGSDESEDGINWESCPLFKTCEGHAVSEYWGAASTNYAKYANGAVTVMLNGSMANGRLAFRDNSFFATVEVVGLPIPVVHTLHIWIINDIGVPPTEQCGMGSPAKLVEVATGLGLEVTCENNPPEIKALLCVDKPESAECAQFA
jgi:platelet/endothelial cell adhesion protein/ADP-ribosyl cyclase 2